MKNITTKIIPPTFFTWLDYPDDESQALVIFFMGCEHKCIGCQNEIFQDREYKDAVDYSIKQLYDEVYSICYQHKTNKIIFSGGDCLDPANIDFTKQFVKNYGNIFDICIYTGYTINEIKSKDIKGFKFIKTGRYDEKCKQESIKTNSYFQLASSNQEIYNQNFNLVSRNGRMYF
jgi:organic radical activating enzyme